MKIVKDAVIVERVRLADCRAGDVLDIDEKPGGNRSIGKIVLAKVKPIHGGRLQIKYRSHWVWMNRPNVVRKIDLPGDTMVKRTRKRVSTEASATMAPAHVEILDPLPTPIDGPPDDGRYLRGGGATSLDSLLTSDALGGAMAAVVTAAGGRSKRLG